MDDFSTTFEKGYLELLSRQFGTRRVNANQVYNDYIHDRHHVHMNSTMWPTLGDFAKYLGRTGKAKIDETDRGWDVTYIDRNPELLARNERAAAREQAELDAERRHEAELEARIALARALVAREDDEEERERVRKASELRRPAAGAGGGAEDEAGSAGVERVKLGLKGTAAAVAAAAGSGGGAAPAAARSAPVAVFGDDDADEGAGQPTGRSEPAGADVAGVGAAVGVKRKHWDADGAPALLAAGSAAPVKRSRFDAPAAGAAPQTGGAGAPAGTAVYAYGSGAHSAPYHSSSGGASARPTLAAASGGPAPLSTIQALIAEETRKKAQAAALAAASLRPSAGSVPAASAAAAPAVGGAGGAGASAPADDEAPWLLPGIVVKIMNKRLAGGAYYKQKGAVTRVEADNPWVGIVSVAAAAGSTVPLAGVPAVPGANVLLKVDQTDLETTIPAVGEGVIFVRGRHRGQRGVLRRLHIEEYQATVELAQAAAGSSSSSTGAAKSAHGGRSGGVLVEGVEYEDICRLA